MAERPARGALLRHRTGVLVATGVGCALPVLGLVVLLRRPDLDVHLRHDPGHFWLVLLAAATAAVLAHTMSVAAGRRGDPRVLLVALVFLSCAGFLGLHALATPGVLLPVPNAGFTLATPVGIALGALAAVASGVDTAEDRTARWVRLGGRLRAGLLVLLVAWAVASLARLPPFRGAGVPERASGVLAVVAVPAVLAYALSAARYARLWWRRPSSVLLAMSAAFALLGEAMVAVVVAPSWALSWWQWHVLLLAAVALVGLGVRAQWHEERYADLYSAATVAGHREVSVVFADLAGYTSFAERHPPAEVAAMLNAYFEVAVPPVVRRFRGDVDRIIGDALMVTFNRRGDQPDHAHRAAAAALALHRATDELADRHDDWPRFRTGVNSGPALVSVLGTAGARTHTVIGDTVNVAARVQAAAPAGAVAVTGDTLALLPRALADPLGRVAVRGRSEPVEVYRLRAVDAPPGPEPAARR